MTFEQRPEESGGRAFQLEAAACAKALWQHDARAFSKQEGAQDPEQGPTPIFYHR